MIGKTVIIENLNLTPDPDEPLLEGWMSPVSLFDQPERLNPENHLVGDDKVICDSPNNANK